MFEGPVTRRLSTTFQSPEQVANELAVLRALVELREEERIDWLLGRMRELEVYLEERRPGGQLSIYGSVSA